MNQRIVYTNDNGSVSVITPVADCGLTIEKIALQEG
jgi:hypothetical protein